MTDKSDKPDALKGLTPKQQKFAEHIAMGLNPSDAYRAAGYTADKAETVATEAYRLLHHPQVSPIIDQMRRESLNGAITTRRTLLDRLEAVNRKAYEEIAENGVSVSYRAFQAFMQSFEKLLPNVVNDTWESIASAEQNARTDDVFKMFDTKTWFK